jgi:hypothetical protein
MSPNTRRLIISSPVARFVSIAALLGAAFLSGPVGAQPQTAPSASAQTTAMPAETRKETVEERIINLHGALQITPDEETAWTRVAQTMRDNEAVMQTMISERAALDPASITAVDDMKSYERFTKAHVRGLRKLIVSFETLYASMPNAQKSIADQTFKTFGHEGVRSHT